MALSSPNNGLDSLMFGVPLIGLLVFGYFRLDEIFARKAPSETQHHPPRRRGIIEEIDVEPTGSDPDGRAWEKPLARRY